jgi:GTP-binding protein HflX
LAGLPYTGDRWIAALNQEGEVTISKLIGNLNGLKSSQTAQLSRLYRRRVTGGQLFSYELAEQLVAAAWEVMRPLAVLLDRAGHVTHVVVGEGSHLPLPPLKKREAAARLSGWRAVIAHPGGGGLSRPDLVALVMNRLDCTVAIATDRPRLSEAEVYVAHMAPEADAEGNLWRVLTPMTLKQAQVFDFATLLQELEQEFAAIASAREVDTQGERAILIGVQTPESGDSEARESLAELARLAETAGAQVLDASIQKRANPDPATHIGKGKVAELALRSRELNATSVMVDAELSPSQQRKLEEAFGLKVVDRTALILDIFAQRAQTREGKLQVELAQLKYLLPRLRGVGVAMSRLGGGIGTRGPGETKLETDRRRIYTRIAHLENEVALIKKHRGTQRQGRRRSGTPQIALVGYTNAGKSTLLNKLTRSEVLAEDKLFATLDPITRKLHLPGGADVLLTDTVGFIQRLPTHLIAAFRATLEEVTEADLLLHVLDASHPNAMEHLNAVLEVLAELGAGEKPMLTVLNKVDALEDAGKLQAIEAIVHAPVAISALSGDGLPELLTVIEAELVHLRQTTSAGREE